MSIEARSQRQLEIGREPERFSELDGYEQFSREDDLAKAGFSQEQIKNLKFQRDLFEKGRLTEDNPGGDHGSITERTRLKKGVIFPETEILNEGIRFSP